MLHEHGSAKYFLQAKETANTKCMFLIMNRCDFTKAGENLDLGSLTDFGRIS